MTPAPPATMAVHLDAGKRDGKRREVFVLLDAGANVIDVIEGDKKDMEERGHQTLPVFGPLDIMPGALREILQLKRQGNPRVQQRRGGRWISPKHTLGATIEERTRPLKNRLLRKERRRRR